MSLFLDNLALYRHRDDSVVILDVGSRHGLEAIKFLEQFPKATVFCIEANPLALEELRSNVSNYTQIRVIGKAVNSFDGECDFYAIDPNATITPHPDGNLGASSLFEARSDLKIPEKYVQKLIRVPCMRLDTFFIENNISRVDAIWMDLQGAELVALETIPESMFATMAVVQSELETQEIYRGQGLFSDVHAFMEGKGFELKTSMPHGDISGDHIFVNSRLTTIGAEKKL